MLIFTKYKKIFLCLLSIFVVIFFAKNNIASALPNAQITSITIGEKLAPHSGKITYLGVPISIKTLNISSANYKLTTITSIPSGQVFYNSSANFCSGEGGIGLSKNACMVANKNGTFLIKVTANYMDNNTPAQMQSLNVFAEFSVNMENESISLINGKNPSKAISPDAYFIYSFINNDSITATLISDNAATLISGDNWLQIDSNHFQKEYSRIDSLNNGAADFIKISDVNGNTASFSPLIVFTENNNTVPTAKISKMLNDDNTVTLTLTANKSIITPEDWSKISDTVFTKTFKENQVLSTVNLVDEFNNAGSSESFEITEIDDISPKISNINFTDGTLTGNIDDLSANIEIQLNDNVYRVKDFYENTWSIKLDLPAGQYNVKIIATDLWGNSETTLFDFFINQIKDIAIYKNEFNTDINILSNSRNSTADPPKQSPAISSKITLQNLANDENISHSASKNENSAQNDNLPSRNSPIKESSVWSFINLILTLINFIILISIFLSNKNKISKIAVFILTLLMLWILFFTTNFTGNIVLLNNSSWIFILFFAISQIIFIFSKTKNATSLSDRVKSVK